MTPKLSRQKRLELIKKALKGKSVSKICREEGISRVIFYRWVNRYKEKGKKGLGPLPFGRPRKTARKPKIDYPRLSSSVRLKMVGEVLLQDGKPTDVAGKYGISRTTLYKWIRRYREAADDDKWGAIESKRPVITRYFNQVHPEFEKRILLEVSRHPEYGVRRLITTVPRFRGKPVVGHHGIQNILKRNNLNTFEFRLEYAKAQR